VTAIRRYSESRLAGFSTCEWNERESGDGAMQNKIKTNSVQLVRHPCLSGIAVAVASRLLVIGHVDLNVTAVETGSTGHFWYRFAPEGPYVDSHRENKAFGFGGGEIFLSEDNGQAWPGAPRVAVAILLLAFRGPQESHQKIAHQPSQRRLQPFGSPVAVPAPLA